MDNPEDDHHAWLWRIRILTSILYNMINKLCSYVTSTHELSRTL